MNSKLDLNDAKSAFNTFFNNPNSSTAATTATATNNPVDKVLNQIRETNSPPDKRTINKVDMSAPNTSNNSIETMSVDEAERILDQEKSFDDILKDLKVQYSELFAVIDFFLTNGYYEEEYHIKSFAFTLRTKSVFSVEQINDALDGSKYTLPSAAGHLLIQRSLAACLTKCKLGKNPVTILSHQTAEDEETALEFVRKLSTPIYGLMVSKLRKFELLAGLATRDEAIERFLEHTQD